MNLLASTLGRGEGRSTGQGTELNKDVVSAESAAGIFSRGALDRGLDHRVVPPWGEVVQTFIPPTRWLLAMGCPQGRNGERDLLCKAASGLRGRFSGEGGSRES